MVVNLKQADFINGSYRIHKAGEYKLIEDIVFNPISNRNDMPKMGWFCALSIETDNVTLNLNCHSIKFHPDFIKNNIKTYGNSFLTIISLNNTTILDKVMNYYFGYNDDIVYDVCKDPINFKFKVANNVVIRNGCLQTSPKDGIKGFYCKGVNIDNVQISDFETTGISILGGSIINIRDCDIQGLICEHFSQPILTTLTVALQTLKDNRWKKCDILCKNNLPDDHIKTIECILKNHKEQGLAKEGYSPSNVIGIHLGAIPTKDIFFGQSSGLSIRAGQRTIPIDCSNQEIERIYDVLIKNVKIHKMMNDTKTVEGIRDKENNLLMMAGNVGVIRWMDVFSNCKFNPNKLSQALAFNMLCLFDDKLTPEYIKVLKSIVYKNNNLFNETGFKERAILTDGTFPHGSFGIRIDYGYNVTIKDSEIYNFESIGKKPYGYKLGLKNKNLVTTMEKKNLDESIRIVPRDDIYNEYQGNDVTGIGLNTTSLENVIMDNVKIHDLHTKDGKISAIQIMSCDYQRDDLPLLYNFCGGITIKHGLGKSLDNCVNNSINELYK